VTATGKLLRRHAQKSHNLEKKSAKRRRKFRKALDVSSSDEKNVARQLGMR
jgi:ribosomal protein L35